MQSLEDLADVIEAHFATDMHRCQAVAHYRRGFEDWLKWEIVSALHRFTLTSAYKRRSLRFAWVVPERNDCDIAICKQVGPNPPQDQDDIWLELKHGIAHDSRSGIAELVVGIKNDIQKLKRMQAAKTITLGTAIVIAIITSDPYVDVSVRDNERKTLDPVRVWFDQVKAAVGSQPIERSICRDLPLASGDKTGWPLAWALLAWTAGNSATQSSP